MENKDRLRNAGVYGYNSNIIIIDNNNKFWILLLLLLSYTTVTVYARTRHGDGVLVREQHCNTKSSIYYCQNNDLNQLSIPVGITKLQLYNVTGTLKLNNVTQLKWTDSNIIELNSAIIYPNYLRILDLTNNDIKTLKNYQFKDYNYLNYMNLSNNKINDLPRNVFVNLSLEYLGLSHNKLHVIPFQVFAPMQQLRLLDISYNYIVTILDHFFKFNKRIEVLLLNNNRIEKLTSNALADLTDMKELDLSSNSLRTVSKGLFDSLNNLQYLSLANNPIINIPSGTFRGLQSLMYLDISGNRLKQLTYGIFHFSQRITTLTLDNTQIEIIHNSELLGLPHLKNLNIRNNLYLKEMETYVFQDTPQIESLDISGNALTFLPMSLGNLTQMKSLNITDNHWACDCRMFWFAPWAEERKAKDNISLSELSCGPHAYPNDMLRTLHHLNCTEPRITYKTPTNQYRLNTNALLECRYAANPPASITWITPTRDVYHWNPDPSIDDVFHKHPHAHNKYMIPTRTIPPRIQVLDNGTLYIQNVTREDCGRYKCYASNPIANATDDVLLHIDPTDWNNIRIYSIFVGIQCAAGFLGLTLLVQLLRYILNK